MRTPGRPRDQVTLETAHDTNTRLRRGYVTERERRFAKHVSTLTADGTTVPDSWIGRAMQIQVALTKRGEVI